MRKVKYLSSLLILLGSTTWAQELLLAGSPVYLKTSATIPQDLLSTKTAVIVDVGNSGLDWKNISESAHTQFIRTGIDAIAYFEWSKLFSGYDPQNEISTFLNTRQVANLVLISATSTMVEVGLTKFNKQWTFMNNQQDAWYSKDSTVYRALLPLYQRAALNLERKNLLISDSPEYYNGLVFHNQKVNEIYPPNVKGFKTCVALMPLGSPPANMPNGLQRAYETYSNALEARNETIREEATRYYPFQSEFFEYGPDRDQIRTDKGCNFYLAYVYGSAIDVKKMFKSEINNSREIPINSVLSEKPILRNISGDRNTFKFYFRNTVTGEIFVGSGWDADVTIVDALHNFIFYLKRDLKVNP